MVLIRQTKDSSLTHKANLLIYLHRLQCQKSDSLKKYPGTKVEKKTYKGRSQKMKMLYKDFYIPLLWSK